MHRTLPTAGAAALFGRFVRGVRERGIPRLTGRRLSEQRGRSGLHMNCWIVPRGVRRDVSAIPPEKHGRPSAA